MELQIVQRLRAHAAHTPDAEALRELDDAGRCLHVLTYRQFADAVCAAAHRLRATQGEQPVVLISYPNGLHYAVAFFGVLAAGGTAFPVHPRLADTERTTAALRSRAGAYVGADTAIAGLEALGLNRIAFEDLIPTLGKARLESARCETAFDLSDRAKVFLQSSGTIGPPKIVERSGHSLDAVAKNVAASVGLTPDDRVLGLIPACHSYGVENVMLGPIWAGCCVQLCRGIDALRTSPQRHEPMPTVIPGVPTLFEMLAAATDSTPAADSPLRRVRRVYSAGAALPACVFEGFQEKFGVRIGQLYGMTEIGSVAFNDPDRIDLDPMSVGLPMSGVSIRIVDPETQRLERPLEIGCEGEVAVSAPSMLTGYLRDDASVFQPPAVFREGYFLTGDLGKLDTQGRLTITGRLKLVVDVSGLKVNLLEVERTVCEHEMVRECVVVPVAVSATVMRLKAYVVARQDNRFCADELRAFLRTRLSAHKIPRAFEVRTSFPRSATGKILRQELAV